VLLVALGALFALLHQADSRDTVTLALPGDAPDASETSETPAQAQAPAPAPAVLDPAAPEAAAGTADPSALAAAPADSLPVTTPGALSGPMSGPLPGAMPATVAPAARPPAAPAPGTSTGPAPQVATQAPTYRPVPAASGATYKLVIKPWGMVQVDGVDQGASPPLKRLTLSPGQHTIRIVNPNFPEHTVTVNAVKGASSVIEMDFTEEEAQ
jgi:hypothetical protein